LEYNEGDANLAFREACVANFGVDVGGCAASERELSPTFMFRDGGDLQGVSGDTGRRADIIKKHLAALKQFAEADLQAALDEETYDEGDASMGSGSDDSDDEPLANKVNRGESSGGRAVTAREIAV
jgi:hypothetical protein